MSGVGPGIIDIVDFANSVPTHARTKVRAYTSLYTSPGYASCRCRLASSMFHPLFPIHELLLGAPEKSNPRFNVCVPYARTTSLEALTSSSVGVCI